jgi:hypothetical protein
LSSALDLDLQACPVAIDQHRAVASGVCESAATRRKDKLDFIFVGWTGAAGKVSLGF